jgi:dihydroorotate dehydrogenase
MQGMSNASETGGLSGAPLKPMADDVLTALRNQLPEDMAMIGVGGITRGQDAVDKLQRGANLVQFYTGMVYRGPVLLNECLQAINKI